MSNESNSGGAFGALDSISNFLRTLLALAVAGAVGVVGWFGYNHFAASDIAERTIKEKDELIAVKTKENDELRTTNTKLSDDNARLAKDLKVSQENLRVSEVKRKLLKIDHRIAQINVLDQGQDPEGHLFTKIEFVEQNDEGQSIDKPQQFTLKGDMVYVEYWTVQFKDEYVEEADLLRGTSICLFRRIFSSKQEPDAGFVLDKVNSRPTAYSRGDAPSEFEEKIWKDFWQIANSKERSAELGIRAIHGDAVSHKLVLGKKYRVTIRASGGPSIGPIDEPAPAPTPPVTPKAE